jgi:hypothetical protein
VNVGSYPSIAGALAAERHSRFIVEADHRRRLAQVHRGRGRDTAPARCIRTVQVKARSVTARVAAWGARWQHQLSLLGDS